MPEETADDGGGFGFTLDDVGNWANTIGGIAAQAKAIFQPATGTIQSQPTAPAPSAPQPSSFGSLQQPKGLMAWISSNPFLAAGIGILGLGTAAFVLSKLFARKGK